MIRYNKNKKANEICLVEIFKSLNGEAYNSGAPAVFVRTLGCNLRCCFGTILDSENLKSTLNGFCDTPESFNLSNFKKMYPNKEPLWMTAKEIFNKVESLEQGWRWKSLTLSGGEPALEENKDFLIKELLPFFVENHYDVGIETNGSVDYEDYKKAFGKAKVFNDNHREGVSIVADWKLPSSKMSEKMLAKNLDLYDETDVLKLVTSSSLEDLKMVEKLCSSNTKAQIYLSPVYGNSNPEKLWKIAEKYASKGVKVQLQIHKYFFKNPNEKGV